MSLNIHSFTHLLHRWVFIRYKTKNGALAALQRYSSDYDMHIADEKNTSASHSKVPRSGDNGMYIYRCASVYLVCG